MSLASACDISCGKVGRGGMSLQKNVFMEVLLCVNCGASSKCSQTEDYYRKTARSASSACQALKVWCRLLGRPRLDFFRGHAIERGRGDVQKAEHQIDLATVVGFVLDHGPQPLPGGDRGAGWGEAFPFKVRVRQRPENRQRFHAERIQESHNRLEALGKVTAASGVAAGASRHRLCVHVALDCSKMPHEVAEGELAGMRAPLDLVRRNTNHDAARTAANGSPIVEERSDRANFH